MTKLDYEKIQRTAKSRRKVVTKAGALTDFAGEDQQDSLIALQGTKSKMRFPPHLIHKYELVCKCIKEINSGHYSKLSGAERAKFLTEYYAAHSDLIFFGNSEYGYENTNEFRISARFLESVRHLIDERKYWRSR